MKRYKINLLHKSKSSKLLLSCRVNINVILVTDKRYELCNNL